MPAVFWIYHYFSSQFATCTLFAAVLFAIFRLHTVELFEWHFMVPAICRWWEDVDVDAICRKLKMKQLWKMGGRGQDLGLRNRISVRSYINLQRNTCHGRRQFDLYVIRLRGSSSFHWTQLPWALWNWQTLGIASSIQCTTSLEWSFWQWTF